MKTFLKKKNKASGISLPNSETYHLESVIKNVVTAKRQTHRSMDRIKNPEIDPHKQAGSILTRMEKQFRGGNMVFLTSSP